MKSGVLLFLFAVLAASCTKENALITTQLKENFFFAPSSYWVYQDSISGAVDSFVVTRYERRMNIGNVENEESIKLYFNKYRDGLLTDTSNSRWTLGIAGVSAGYFVSPDIGNVDFFFWYPYGSLQTGSNSDGSTYAITSLPYRTIHNHSYFPTAQAVVTDNTGTITDKFYVTAQVGLVQMVIDHPSLHENWQLLRYYIAK